MDKLKKFFQANPKTALAFSGGSDSAFLLKYGLEQGADIRTYFIKSQFQPQFEYEDAKRLADECGAKLEIVGLNALSSTEIRSNPENRCYYCKKNLFSTLVSSARADGYNIIIDGTNASDSYAGRPGMKVLDELGIISPLRLCGITKSQIRLISRDMGLFTWNKPSYSCLATRIPTGTEITPELLSKVENSEVSLREMGFSDFRVRIMGSGARLEVTDLQIPLAAQLRHEIQNAMSPHFKTLYLDLKGREPEI